MTCVMRRRSLTTHVMDLSGSAYGTILASSIVAALSYKERGNAWVMIGALVATELVFALARLQGLEAHAAVAVGALSSGLGVVLVVLKLALH